MIDMKIISGAEYEKLKKEKEFVIRFGFEESPFGKCLIGLFGQRVCHLSFVAAEPSANLRALEAQWPGSTLISDEKLIADVAEKIFGGEVEFCEVLLKGSPFEGKVWRALGSIGRGETLSYEDVALASGHGKAVRAAANAVAKNPVAYLVPCHRVVKKDGNLHKYRWGSEIKKKILQFEKRDCRKTV